MERELVHLNNEHSVGLGDNLCLLSMLANIPAGVDLVVTNNHNTFDRLSSYKKIFRIKDDSLKIIEGNSNGKFNNVGWPLKLLTEYYRPEHVFVNNATVSTNNTREKQFLAIASAWKPAPPGEEDKWPYARHRPLRYWEQIYGWAKELGYEIITLDNPYTSLEDKIEFLVKNCAAVISYEGGMAHLAHMLNIPCFIVNWNWPSPSTVLDQFHVEHVHMSRTAYILDRDHEIQGWSKNHFQNTLNELKQGRTNNRLLNGTCRIDYEGPGIYGRMIVRNNTTKEIMLNHSGLYSPESEHGALITKYFAPK